MNKQWQLARKPQKGYPEAEDFAWIESDLPAVGANQMLTKTLYLSMDPYQWVRRRSGTELPGEVCHGRTVSRVVDSKLDGYAEGDSVFNTNGWQAYGLTGEGISVFNYMHPRKLDPTLAPVSTAIGIMGMLGLTAYSGLIVQCQPQAGETVVVSAASGGVGQVVGQLAKLRGCRVVGIAGAEHKCEFVKNELRLDECVSHLSENMADELAAACPDGIDVYFENVGGPVFEAVLPLLNQSSRISLCGVISQYANSDGGNPREVWQQTGQSWFDKQNTVVHDLFVGNFVEEFQDQFLAEMGDYVSRGVVHYREDIWQGLEKAPEAFGAMLKGGNFGKTIVQVAS